MSELLKFRPSKKGIYRLTVTKFSEQFFKLRTKTGFDNYEDDRQALINGVNRPSVVRSMKENQAKAKLMPFDYTQVPSEQLPWIIECSRRNPQYQLWDARIEHAQFWNKIAKASKNFKNIKNFIS